MRHHLAEGWTLSAVPGSGPIPPELHDLSVPATVPGCVHTDPLEVGLIPDPYLDRNEAELQWLGVCAWRYQCSFEAGPELLAHERVELVCEGLEHRRQSRAERGAARRGGQHAPAPPLRPRWAPALPQRPRHHLPLEPAVTPRRSATPWASGPTPTPCPSTSCARWPATSVGIGVRRSSPRGIWQPIYLEAWSGARIASLRPLSTLATGLNWAQISLQVELDWAPNAGEGVRLEASLPRPDRIELGVEGASLTLEPGQREAVLRFEVDSPLLWCGRGATASSRSTIWRCCSATATTGRWRGAKAASAFAGSNSTPPPTPPARASPSESTIRRSSFGAPTGFRTTASRPGSMRSVTAGASSRRATPT